jgi:AcrR family transcriptional regulator
MPYRRTDKVEARLAGDRERILRTARQLVTEGGFREAQIAAVAAMAEVGIGTIYRHFPTRSDLIIAVYRHQVEACAEAGPALLATADSPFRALRRWIDLFVDFLVTKHGLAGAMQSDSAGFDVLHAYFVDRLVPVCAQLLAAATAAGEARPGTDAYELMRGIGGLCATSAGDSGYDPRKLVGLLLDGLRNAPA